MVYSETSLEFQLPFQLKQMHSRVSCPASSGVDSLEVPQDPAQSKQ